MLPQFIFTIFLEFVAAVTGAAIASVPAASVPAASTALDTTHHPPTGPPVMLSVEALVFVDIDISGDGLVQLAITKTTLFSFTASSGWMQQTDTGLVNQLYVDLSLDGTLYTISNGTHWKFYHLSSISSDGQWIPGTLYSSGSYPQRSDFLKSSDEFEMANNVNNFNDLKRWSTTPSTPSTSSNSKTKTDKTGLIDIVSIGIDGKACTNDLSCSFGHPFAQAYIGAIDESARDIFTISSTIPVGWENTVLSSCSISSNGSIWLLSSFSGLRLSWDYGVSWTAPTVPSVLVGDKFKIHNGDISHDGKYMTIVAGTSVIASANYGLTWNVVRSFSYPPISSTINTDGSFLSIVSIYIVYLGSECTTSASSTFICASWKTLSTRPNPISYLLDSSKTSSNDFVPKYEMYELH